jgi:hypothetical protein
MDISDPEEDGDDGDHAATTIEKLFGRKSKDADIELESVTFASPSGKSATVRSKQEKEAQDKMADPDALDAVLGGGGE